MRRMECRPSSIFSEGISALRLTRNDLQCKPRCMPDTDIGVGPSNSTSDPMISSEITHQHNVAGPSAARANKLFAIP